jgi:hypothetical protein
MQSVTQETVSSLPPVVRECECGSEILQATVPYSVNLLTPRTNYNYYGRGAGEIHTEGGIGDGVSATEGGQRTGATDAAPCMKSSVASSRHRLLPRGQASLRDANDVRGTAFRGLKPTATIVASLRDGRITHERGVTHEPEVNPGVRPKGQARGQT